MNNLTSTPAVDAVRRTPSSRWILASLALSTLLPALDTSIANAGLPVLAQAFDASFTQVQWVVLAYLLSITALIVGAGRLGDLLGRRRLLLTGIGLFSAASLLCGLAPSLGWLLAGRAIQGLGAAIMLALGMALVGDALPESRRGRAMGLLGSISALGTTLGPALGGVLIASVGWQAIFLINLPLGLLNAALVWRYLPADGPRASTAFDWPGTLLLALTLGCFALAMTWGQGALLMPTAVGAALFIWRQARARVPLIRLQLLGNRQLRAGLGMTLLVSTVIMSTLVVGPFYLSQGLGLGPMAVGLALSAGPCVAALCGVPAGQLVDRRGAASMTRSGLLGMACAASLLAISPLEAGIIGYLAPILLLTASYALFQAANNSRIMGAIDAQQRGVVAGLLSLSRNLGLISGTAIMGGIFALGTGTRELITAAPSALATGLHWTFALAAGLMVLALVIGRRLSG